MYAMVALNKWGWEPDRLYKMSLPSRTLAIAMLDKINEEENKAMRKAKAQAKRHA